jgi:DnaJ-class molecular chaperone
MQIVQDYYEVLEILPSANNKEIKEAYRKLAFQYHPDRNQMNPAANKKMLEVNEAYAILSDSAKRKDYDFPRGYYTAAPKFKTGDKVRINYHAHNTAYRDYSGVIDKEPIKDTFRFWYMVRFESKGFSTVSRFAEEELNEDIDR